MLLALSGLWSTIIVGAVILGFVLLGYTIWQLRSEEGWQERPKPPSGE